MASQMPVVDSTKLSTIAFSGVTIDDVEKMELSALKDALKAVIREEGSTCTHQNHGSHSNSHGNSTIGHEL